MKKLILVAVMALMGLPSFAQFSTGSKSSAAADNSDYSRVSVSWNLTTVSPNKEYDGDDVSLNGVGIDYLHGFSISKKLPLFFETGVKLNFGTGKNEYDDDYTQKYKFFTASIPLNIAYRLSINDDVAITPYLGLNLKVHAMGKYKNEFEGEDDFPYYYDDDDEDEWYNLFDKDDMDGKDNTFNRFQLGWHIGAGVQYKKFYLGISYGTDFTPLHKYKKEKINTSDFVASIGFCF